MVKLPQFYLVGRVNFVGLLSETAHYLVFLNLSQVM